MNDAFTLPNLDDSARIARQGTIAQRVFETLKHAIVQLHLRPGNLLSEAEVAKQLGVSRQPVREAFIKLSEVGLVEIRPQRGTFVVMISKADVENARFIREAVEVAVARKACTEASKAQLTEIAAIIQMQRDANEQGDHAQFLRLDETFHRALAIAVDCEHAWRVIENLKAQMDRVRYLSIPLATPIDTLINQHQTILDAITSHDPEKAEQAIRVHLSEIINSLPKIAAANPDMFVG